MKVILSTRNPSKTEQIQAIFNGLPITVLTLSEVGVEGEAVEDGSTLKENALKKALFAHEYMDTKLWVMADDTGLFIDALNGEPGVRAARWAGETATTEEITQFTLNKLAGKNDRTATFETVVALVSPDGTEHFFTGAVRGKLLESPRVPPQPKMPYSPLFIPDGSDQVWAEMTVEYENSVSHRGIAFRAARDFLSSLIV